MKKIVLLLLFFLLSAIAVSQEDAADKRQGFGTAFDDSFDFFEGADAEFRGFIHIAKTASIMRTADGYAQDKAAGFTGRAKNEAAGIVNDHKNHTFQ